MSAQLLPAGILWTNSQGYITREWYRYLDAQYTQLGGTSGLMPVSSGGTGLGAGVSGGVPYYDSATTMAVSGILDANQIVFGGGAGNAPKTVGILSSKQNQILLSGTTSGALPSWSVAAYPAYALNAGQIMRANGNDWKPTTATFPDTSKQWDILFSSADNVWTAGEMPANNVIQQQVFGA